MCVIIACPPGSTPFVGELIDAADYNPDGHGFVFRTPEGLVHFKSLDPEEAIERFLDAREEWPDVWAVWHSRIATQGPVDPTNIHPFIVPNNGWAMAHNGILPLSDGPLGGDERSDSRILAEDYLSKMSWSSLDTHHDEIDNWLSPSKIVVLSPHDEAGGPIRILGEKRGRWFKGCWYSNLNHQWTPPPKSKWSSFLTAAEVRDDEEAEEAEYYAELEDDLDTAAATREAAVAILNGRISDLEMETA